MSKSLWSQYIGVNRIQFIDNNILPPIANQASKGDYALSWTEEFLHSLSRIKEENKKFSWRGSFRYEDFLTYKEKIAKWEEVLSHSGCMLLGFGVEYGSEKRRIQAKGGWVTNEQIMDLNRVLHNNNIMTKGFFIIGGNSDSKASASETIEFSIASGFSLAYYALYKDFRTLSGRYDKPNVDARTENELLKFKKFDLDLQELVTSCKDENECKRKLGSFYSKERIKEADETVKKLSHLGFKFEEIFKYNDYHEQLDTINSISHVWDIHDENQTSDFLKCVRRAYFEFYTRNDFIKDYEILIKGGY